MRGRVLVWASLLGVLASAGSARAQFVQPEQFYSNGTAVDAWTHDAARRLKFTFWFAQYSKEDWPYRQQIVIIFDDNPNKAYYFDVGTRRFEGRFDLDDMGYSMLPPEKRRERLEDIPEEDFPPSGGMPTVGEMLRRSSDRQPGSDKMMMMPPPTADRPRLEDSIWETTYTTPDRRSIRARLLFDGENGQYIPEEGGQQGGLKDVRYINRGAAGHLITGRWSLGDSGGYFQFTIPRGVTNEFEGTWGIQPRSVDGSWRGTRTRPR